jgi:TRAP-type C4-dicarboxylate transport system permease small subunit
MERRKADEMSALVALADRLIRIAAVALLLALLASVMIGVVSRQIGRPVPWSDEMAQYLLVWTGVTGWMIAARRGNHIRINVFIDLLPRGLRLLVEIAIQLAVIAFAVLLIRWGWPLVDRNWDIDWVSLPLPAGLLYVPAPIAAVALILQAATALVEAIRGRLPHEPAPGAQPL